MSINLYDASVLSYLQTVKAVSKTLKLAEEAAADNILDLESTLDFQLRDNMLPFSFQVISVWHHSLGALKGMKAGLFEPPPKVTDLSWSKLKELLKEAEDYRKSVDFIQKYIFPGGMLPSPEVLRSEAQKVGLDCVKSIEFGESYSKTLRLWHSRFNDKWDQVAAMGFDDRFRRMWNFYLTSCAATFHYANCDVTQITLSKPA